MKKVLLNGSLEKLLVDLSNKLKEHSNKDFIIAERRFFDKIYEEAINTKDFEKGMSYKDVPEEEGTLQTKIVINTAVVVINQKQVSEEISMLTHLEINREIYYDIPKKIATNAEFIVIKKTM